MRTIYAVSSGEYSGYRVLALFDEKADAETAVAVYNTAEPYDDAFIEEFKGWAAGDRYMIPTWKVEAILLREAINVKLTRPGLWWGATTLAEWQQHHDDIVKERFDWEGHGGTYRLTEPELVVIREGTDPQQVRQSFSDRCAQYKAESGATWPTPDLQWLD